MTLEDIYMMLKAHREEMYEKGTKTVELQQTEFFEIYQVICYMMQIKNITDTL